MRSDKLIGIQDYVKNASSDTIFVLDTSALIREPMLLEVLEGRRVCIPAGVIDELDHLKGTYGPTARVARKHLRYLVVEKEIFHATNDIIINALGYGAGDDAVIASCHECQTKMSGVPVVLLSADYGLLVRAHAANIAVLPCEGLSIESLYPGYQVIHIPDEVAHFDLRENVEYNMDQLDNLLKTYIEEAHPLEYFEIHWGNRRWLGVVKDRSSGRIFQTLPFKTKSYIGIEPKDAEQHFAMSAIADPEISLVVLYGPAGVGKTLIPISVGLHLLLSEKQYKKIVAIKPTVPVGGVDLGAFPGTKRRKMENWLGSMGDNLLQVEKDKSSGKVRTIEDLANAGMLEIESLSQVQGRSIAQSLIIVEEAQGLTQREARLLVERCGPGSKIIMSGDLSQIENPRVDRYSSGLRIAIEGCKDSGIAAVVKLSNVYRSEIANEAGNIFGD